MGGQEPSTRVIPVLRECIWNAPTVSLLLPAFDGTGSLGSPPRQVMSIPWLNFSPWVTVSRFLSGNKEADLKPITFS